MSAEKKDNDERVSYWVKRMKADGERMNKERKLNILKALLVDYIGLTPEECRLFLKRKTPLDKGGIPGKDAATYLSAEGKVADFFADVYEKEEAPRRLKFYDSLRHALEGFYTDGELDEILSYALPDVRSDTLLVKWFVGAEHYIFRRIRNAYLPLITDFLVVGPDGVDEVDLFETDEEPVDVIDKLLSD